MRGDGAAYEIQWDGMVWKGMERDPMVMHGNTRCREAPTVPVD